MSGSDLPHEETQEGTAIVLQELKYPRIGAPTGAGWL